MQNPTERAVTRVRHEIKRRVLTVKQITHVSPHLLRVTLAGDDLVDFVSASFDDHVKVFFPAPGATDVALPELGPNGLVLPEGAPKPIMRDFTPRRFDREARELDLEFVLHHPGPASQWAAQATVGQTLAIGGPRGSFVIPTDFDWHLLIGDDTALPAIARRLAELPAGTRTAVVVEVADESAKIEFATQAEAYVIWRYRNTPGGERHDGQPAGAQLVAALSDLPLPEGDGYVWAAGEAAAMRAVRQHLCDTRGVHKSRIRASAYWKRGAAGVHESLDD